MLIGLEDKCKCHRCGTKFKHKFIKHVIPKCPKCGSVYDVEEYG